MSPGQFFKQHLAIIIGLALPVVIMIFFMISTWMPQMPSDPPKYDLIFTTQDYSSNTQSPLNVNFLVKDGVLTAQYTKNTNNNYYSWKKLYIYSAKTQKIELLPFGYPANFDKMPAMEEQVVEATKHFKLDTNIDAPDGYQLILGCGNYSRGLLSELFWGGNYYNSPCLKKGNNFIKLFNVNQRNYNPSYVQFVGWVKP